MRAVAVVPVILFHAGFAGFSGGYVGVDVFFVISGYLITSADGSAIDVFDWFAVPSITGDQKGLEDTAGDIHEIATWAIIILASVHALAALKHHLLDRDDTLRRMLGMASRNPDNH